MEELDIKDTVTLASGKVVRTGYLSVIPDPPRCYIRLEGMSIAEAAALFSNPAETDPMMYGDIKVEGFRSLLSLSMEENAVKVVLKR